MTRIEWAILLFALAVLAIVVLGPEILNSAAGE